jgi:hypothetical protein
VSVRRLRAVHWRVRRTLRIGCAWIAEATGGLAGVYVSAHSILITVIAVVVTITLADMALIF